jgi:putative ABC transport system substrate-binding protein
MLLPDPRGGYATAAVSRRSGWRSGGVPITARAQTPKVPRIGYLSPRSTAHVANDRAFLQGLRDLGYVEGTNILIESRFADGKFERLPELATDLVRLNVDVIAAAVTQASLAAKAATKTIPIVMLAVSDPVGSGLITSIARPDANITGTSAMSAEVIGKALELLKEIVPQLSRVAVLWNPGNATFQAQLLRESERAAGVLGLQLRKFEVRGAYEFEPAFAAIVAEKVGALLLLPDATLLEHSARIIDFAAKNRLTAVYGLKDDALSGGLMSYGPDMRNQYYRGAAYVDKILKGAKPSDLPVQQPTKFELVINLKTAKALGINIPLPLLGRADEVIE